MISGVPAVTRLALLAGLIVPVFVSGCGSLPFLGGGPTEEEREQARQTQARLDDYAREFHLVISGTSEDIVGSTSDLSTRRATVRWKLSTVPRINEIRRYQDPVDAFLGMWVFTEMMARHYSSGGAKDQFGPSQPIVVAACGRLVGSVDRLAREVLGNGAEYDAARGDLDALVEKHSAVSAVDSATTLGHVEEAVLELRGSENMASWLPTLSLAFINPFSGLNESATAIRYLTDTTDAVVRDVTTELPWRMELMVYDLEERETVVALKESIERFSAGAVSIAASVERLPRDVEQVLERTFQEVEARQDELRLTLQEAEQTASTVHDSLVQAEQVVAGLNQTAAGLREAGKEWNATFQTLGLGGKNDKGSTPGSEATGVGEPGRPFDILEYRDTAAELRATALELRGLLGDVKTLAGAPGEDAPLNQVNSEVQTTIAGAVDQGRAMVDHVMWRALQLLGAILAGALLYRILVSRVLVRPRRS